MGVHVGVRMMRKNTFAGQQFGYQRRFEEGQGTLLTAACPRGTGVAMPLPYYTMPIVSFTMENKTAALFARVLAAAGASRPMQKLF